MSAPVEFVGKRSPFWLFGAGLGVVVFAALCIGIPFSEDFAWGAEIAFGLLLAACAAWLAYVLWAPTMRLTISPEAVTCNSRLAPVRIDRSTGDLLVFEEVHVAAGQGTTGTVRYWKLCPAGSKRGVLLTQWEPDVVAEACRSNSWQVEWRDSRGQVLDGHG
jgi:hypothetical protein